jgi:hypothetical protein
MKKSENKPERILARRLAKHLTAEELRRVGAGATAFSFCGVHTIDDIIS